MRSRAGGADSTNDCMRAQRPGTPVRSASSCQWPPGDLVQAVMGSPAAQRHGEPGLLERELILAVADGRPCGQDVIERRQAVDATRLLVQREILAMSVGRCKQPEGELCEHEGCLVARGMLAVG